MVAIVSPSNFQIVALLFSIFIYMNEWGEVSIRLDEVQNKNKHQENGWGGGTLNQMMGRMHLFLPREEK